MHLPPLRLVLALAFAVLAPVFAAVPPAPGEAVFGPDRYVESVIGDLPVVLTAPHGGSLKPAALANRTEGVLGADLNTLELARALADELHRRTGAHAALVASHLHRSKLDPNREVKEAAQGDPVAARTWEEFHAAIRAALDAAVARHGFAFLVDLHGHRHPIARLELGYALDAKQLNRPDADFDTSELITLSALRDLHARAGGSAATLLRGPASLGAFFNAANYRAVPGPQEPQPGTEPFFAGGYIVRTHAAAATTPRIDGVQIETYYPGLRDTAGNRAAFARSAAAALTTFIETHYPYKFPVAPKK